MIKPSLRSCLSAKKMQGINSLSSNDHKFDPTSQDDFLDQMLSSSWTTDFKSPWAVDLNPDTRGDLSDETAPCSEENVHGFHFDEYSMILAQQQMTMLAARGGMGFPLSLGNGGGDGSVQALINGFPGSLHGSPHHFHHAQGGTMLAQSFGAPGPFMNQTQPQASGLTSNGGGGNTPAQPKQRVRARRGQATDPHSIAERLRRERIADRMKALQELVPNVNKTDKASMLDEIIDYVKFLRLQVKVLRVSRLGGAARPLVADMSSEGGGGDGIQVSGGSPNGTQKASSSNDSLTVTEHQVAKLMEEDMGSAMQYLQGKGLCLMPISLATAISTATCHSRNLMINNNGDARNLLLQSNGEWPTSPSVSVLTVQSATMGNCVGTDGSVKDVASVSKP